MMSLGRLLLHKSLISVAIANIIVCGSRLCELFFNQNPKNSQNFLRHWPKKGFLDITPKLSILGHMLLHKSYINVTIANILLCSLSLYDLPGPKCKN